GLLGVLVITSEYSTGMIRATPGRRAAAPPGARGKDPRVRRDSGDRWNRRLLRRLLRLWGVPAQRRQHADLAVGPGVLRAVAGAGLYLAVLGLFGLGLGAVIRSSAGAIAALFGVLFVPSLLMTLLPQSWQNTVGPYLPMEAGTAVFTVHHQAHTLQPWTG